MDDIVRGNTEFEILGPDGFVSFDGIVKRTDSALKFITTSGEMVVSYSHRFIIDGIEIVSTSLVVGDYLASLGRIIRIEHIDISDLYDPINVSQTHQYIGNNIVHHNCEFLGSSNTLINGQTLRNMSSMIPLKSSMGLDVYEEPVAGHFYFLAGDCAYGVSGDYSAFVVVDATETPYKLVAKYRCNTILPMLFPSIIRKVGLEYNMAHVLIENNDIGRQILDILFQDLEYENLVTTLTENGKTYISPGFAATTQLGVKSNKVVKKIGCFAMKSLLEENKFPIFDADIINELSTFTEQNGTFKADEGKYDDLAISLMLFCWASTNQYFSELTNLSVREKIYNEQQAQIEEQLTPFLIDDGRTQEQESDGSYVWVLDDSSTSINPFTI